MMWWLVSLPQPVIHLLLDHYIGFPEDLTMQEETILILLLNSHGIPADKKKLLELTIAH